MESLGEIIELVKPEYSILECKDGIIGTKAWKFSKINGICFVKSWRDNWNIIIMKLKN